MSVGQRRVGRWQCRRWLQVEKRALRTHRSRACAPIAVNRQSVVCLKAAHSQLRGWGEQPARGGTQRPLKGWAHVLLFTSTAPTSHSGVETLRLGPLDMHSIPLPSRSNAPVHVVWPQEAGCYQEGLGGGHILAVRSFEQVSRHAVRLCYLRNRRVCPCTLNYRERAASS